MTPKLTLAAVNGRVTRLEKRVAQSALRVDNALRHLAESQVKTEQTIRRLRTESGAREKRMDARIGDLVSAIGEFIRRTPRERR